MTQPKALGIINEVRKTIIGKDTVVCKTLMAIIAGGHILLEDNPGVGKTTMALAFSRAMSMSFSRVQFTPETMPSDVVGYSVLGRESGKLEYRPGAIMCHLFLADEINRATPRTQSSLLECMAEGTVTVDGVTRELPPPFFVIATQNPVETLGTYPLPEAQLDRFLMRISMAPPTPEQEVAILERFRSAEPLTELEPVCTQEDILSLQKQSREIYVHKVMMGYIASLSQASRSMKGVELGISPRGTLALLRASQSYALIQGRDFVAPEDVKAVAGPVIAHRLSVSGVTGTAGQKKAAEDLLSSVTVPTEDWGQR